jgi:hypothetical protein
MNRGVLRLRKRGSDELPEQRVAVEVDSGAMKVAPPILRKTMEENMRLCHLVSGRAVALPVGPPRGIRIGLGLQPGRG